MTSTLKRLVEQLSLKIDQADCAEDLTGLTDKLEELVEQSKEATDNFVIQETS